MNRDTAIRLAREAGWNTEHKATNDYLERFAALVVAHERQPLPHEQIEELWDQHAGAPFAFARAIERAHGVEFKK